MTNKYDKNNKILTYKHDKLVFSLCPERMLVYAGVAGGDDNFLYRLFQCKQQLTMYRKWEIRMYTF